MGAGKSTAARSAAEALGTDAIDVDEVIEERLGPADRADLRAGRRGRLPRARGAGHARAARPRRWTECWRSVAARSRSQAIRDGASRATWSSGSTWTSTRPGRGSRHGQRPPAGPRPGSVRAAVTRDREPLYAALADVVVPAARSLAHAGACWPRSRACRATHPGAVGDERRRPTTRPTSGPGCSRARFWPATVPGRRVLVSDCNAGRQYGDALEPLDGRVAIMPGEQSKTIAHAEIVWTELVRAGMTRERRRRRARRRRRRRPRRLLRRHLPARRALRPGARRRSSPRSTPPTAARPASTWPRRRTTSAPSTSPSAVIADTDDARDSAGGGARRRLRRGRQDRADRRRRAVGADPRAAPTRPTRGDRRVRAGQAADRRPGRA